MKSSREMIAIIAVFMLSSSAHAEYMDSISRNFGIDAAKEIHQAIDDAVRRSAYSINPLSALLLDLTGKDEQKRQQATAILSRLIGPDFVRNPTQILQVRVTVDGLTPKQTLSVRILLNDRDPMNPLAPTDSDHLALTQIGKQIWHGDSAQFDPPTIFNGGSALTMDSYRKTIAELRSDMVNYYMRYYTIDDRGLVSQFGTPAECKTRDPSIPTPAYCIPLNPNDRKMGDAMFYADMILKVIDDRVDLLQPTKAATQQWNGEQWISVIVPRQEVEKTPKAVLHVTIIENQDPSKPIAFFALKDSHEYAIDLKHLDLSHEKPYWSKELDDQGKPILFYAFNRFIPRQ